MGQRISLFPLENIPSFSFHDLDFDRVMISCVSSRGTPYTRSMGVGMPKIPLMALDSVFYLYKTPKDAELGDNFGGSGFFVSVESSTQGYQYVYPVTNWHTAVRDGFSTIRVNRTDGSSEIFETDPSDWVWIPNSHDVCILPPLPFGEEHKVVAIPNYAISDRNSTEKAGIGVGEDVFMIGRFVDHDGGKINRPAARFGHISVMPTLISQSNGAKVETYCVDMHSRTGFSGSPVFVYRLPGADWNETLQTGKIQNHKPGFLALLGIHRGQFPEEWKEKTEGEVRTIEGLSGMTLVNPAWAIFELLNLPRFIEGRIVGDKEIAARFGSGPKDEVVVDK